VRKEARNFYFGFLLLPPRKREGIYALYAFFRYIDDAVDLAPPRDFSSLRERLLRILDLCPPLTKEEQAIGRALAWARERFGIPKQVLLEVVDGVLLDLDKTRYQTFEELLPYLYGVASAVGLACLEVFGYRDPRARDLGIRLGYAMQLTNILRDVREDYLRGRIYLPEREWRAYGVREEDFRQTTTPPRLRCFLRDFARRPRKYFAEAAPLWQLLSRDAAACPLALALIYQDLLRRMEEADFEVFEKRHSVPVMRKIFLMARARCQFLV